MATDVNKENRKRKSGSDLIFEVDEADFSPSNTPEPTEENAPCLIIETEISQTLTDTSKEDYISRSESISSNEIHNDSNGTNVILKATMTDELNIVTEIDSSLKLDTNVTCITTKLDSEITTETMAKDELVLVPEISKKDDLRCMDMEIETSKLDSSLKLDTSATCISKEFDSGNSESIILKKLAAVRVDGRLSDSFRIDVGVKQGFGLKCCHEVSTETIIKEKSILVPEISKTDVDLRCMDMEVDNSPPQLASIDKPFISVIFRDKDTALRVRSKITHFIKSIADFDLKLKLTTYPSTLTIDFWEDNGEPTENYDIPKYGKTTANYDTPKYGETTTNYDTPTFVEPIPVKEEPASLDLFVVDTTPSKKAEYRPRYTAVNACNPIGDPEPAINGDIDSAKICRPTHTCFNCDGDHAMKDCTQFRNPRRIALARNKFRSQQQKNVRYHVDDDLKYKHLVPGKISDELRRALDVRKHELPPYVYRMRSLGYPPGWLQEAMISNSKLELFDFQGCATGDGGSDNNQTQKIDASKVVEYPGFNMPPEKGFKDEHKYYNCPPYTEKHNKTYMVEYIERISEQVVAQKESTAVNFAPKEMESDSNSQESACTDKLRRSESPTLIDLELRKRQLLAELEDGSLNSPKPTNEANDKQINPLTKDLIESPIVVSSSFGTPILKSASPYIQLPDSDKFSKDICQVINFENLPDSTGKYEQMTEVINKVRKTVKSTKS